MTDSNAQNSKFSSAWWSVDLPAAWRGIDQKECATISRQPRLGVLQVNAARKPEGVVSDDDLRNFAEQHVVGGKSMVPVEYKSFSGFCIDYMKGHLFWKQWWLRSGNLMIYATYNVERGKETVESNDLNHILSSLRRRDIQ